jgi:protein TonB
MTATTYTPNPLRQTPAWVGILVRVSLVVLVHAAVLFALAQSSPELRAKIEPVLVSIITPPQPIVEPPPPPPTPRVERVKPAPKAPPPAPIAVEPPPQTEPVTAPAPLSEAAPAAIAAPPGPEPAVSSGTDGVATGPAAKPAAPMVAPRFDAAYLNNPRPEYPRAARRLGEHGRVMLRVFVSPAGLPERIELQASSGYPRLDQAARDAVQNWRFVPARRGEEAVGAWVLVPITFVLEG